MRDRLALDLLADSTAAIADLRAPPRAFSPDATCWQPD